RAAPFPAEQPARSPACPNQDLQQKRQPREPDCLRPHSPQVAPGTNCLGSDQSPQRSLTSVAPSCRFTRRIIASRGLFTQPGSKEEDEYDFNAFDHLFEMKRRHGETE